MPPPRTLTLSPARQRQLSLSLNSPLLPRPLHPSRPPGLMASSTIISPRSSHHPTVSCWTTTASYVSCFICQRSLSTDPNMQFGKASNKTLHKPQEKKVVQGGLPGHFGGMAEKPSAHPYGFGPSHSPPMTTLAQQPASGRSSPIPPNFAGYRHRRQGSGAFRFEQQKTPTVC